MPVFQSLMWRETTRLRPGGAGGFRFGMAGLDLRVLLAGLVVVSAQSNSAAAVPESSQRVRLRQYRLQLLPTLSRTERSVEQWPSVIADRKQDH